MAELVRRHEVRTYPTPGDGAAIVDFGRQRLADSPPEVTSLLDEIDALARQVPTDQPWSAPHASEWDAETFASWLLRTGASEDALRFVDRVVFLIGPQNLRSQRAVEKIGAVRVGSRPDASGRESLVYQITPTAYGHRQETPT